MQKTTTLTEILPLIQQLSVVEKVKLIELIAPQIEQALIQEKNNPTTPLWGLCQDLGTAPSALEIDLMREEAWANLPREDI